MALFNYASKEITLKVVYYGPGLSGKTTNLQYLHAHLSQAKQSKLLSLATETDRTLFFDFLPMDLGTVGGFKVKFQLYTVPGQIRYDATRKLVLKGADAVVFVADSQREMLDSNLVSYENMKDNLVVNNLDPKTVLLILQYNKRDMPDIMSVEEMNKAINERNAPYFEAIAVRGEGVQDTFNGMKKLLVQDVTRRQKMYEGGGTIGRGKVISTKVGPARMAVRSTQRPAPPATSSSPGSEAVFGAESFQPPTIDMETFGSSQGVGHGEKTKPSDEWLWTPKPGTTGVGTGAASGNEMASLVRTLTVYMQESRHRDNEMLSVLKEIRDGLKNSE